MIESIKKAVLGDNANETIKSGTLVTTRGIGVIIVGLIGGLLLLDTFDYGPWKELSTVQKFMFVVASGFIWALVASADAIARGYAAGVTSQLVPFAAGLKCTYLVGKDTSGWSVAAARTGPSSAGPPDFLIVKGATFKWAKAAEIEFKQS